VIEYLFEGIRRKFTIGILDKQGAAGESISSWLANGRLSLAQARAIAGQWKADRLAGRDPIAELDARLDARRAAEDVQLKAIASCAISRARMSSPRSSVSPKGRSRGAPPSSSPGGALVMAKLLWRFAVAHE